jgi:hypothetical protein
MRSFSCAAFVAFLLTATSVTAAPFPTPSSGTLPISATSSSTTRVENILDPLEELYQQTATPACGSTSCIITFPATTHVNTLIIRVSCTFQTASGGVVQSASLGGGTGNSINTLTASPYAPYSSGMIPWGINTETYLFIAKGAQPEVLLGTNTSAANFTCTLSGYNT